MPEFECEEPFHSKSYLTRAEAMIHLGPMVGGDVGRANDLVNRAEQTGKAESGAAFVDYNPKYDPTPYAVIWWPCVRKHIEYPEGWTVLVDQD